MLLQEVTCRAPVYPSFVFLSDQHPLHKQQKTNKKKITSPCYLCTCVCVCIKGGKEQVRGQALGVALAIHFIFEAYSIICFLSVCCALQASRPTDCEVTLLSTSHSHAEVLSQPAPCFHTGSGNLNSGCRAFTTSPLTPYYIVLVPRIISKLRKQHRH